MTSLSLMAECLHRDLKARGISSLCLADCEAIMARVLEESATVAARLLARKPEDSAERRH